MRLSSEELRQSYSEPLGAIVEAVKETLERTPPELAADIATHGILLAGGGALLRGFDGLLREETHLPVNLSDSPLTCVVVGAGRSLEEFDAFEGLEGSSKRRGLKRSSTSRLLAEAERTGLLSGQRGPASALSSRPRTRA